MTANAIVMKLNTILADPVDSECKVVYVLCETRKLLEHVPAYARPFALNMYCHWALHVNLHGKDTVWPFLQQIDAFVDTQLVGPEDIGASHSLFRDCAQLDTFRSQLRDFFRSSGIRTELTDDEARWNEFVKHYAGVIEDGSLSIRAPNHGLKHVKDVTFVKGRNATGQFAEIPFDMLWSVSLLDGRKCDIEVNSGPAPDGRQMIGWSVHLH
jgi:hypothetical protein